MSSDTACMSPVKEAAWRSLVVVSELLPAAIDEQLTEDADLIYFEYVILEALDGAPDHVLRMGTLAQTTGSPAPRLSKAISRLERRSLVQRVSCPHDGRGVNIQITGEGRRALNKARSPHLQLVCQSVLADLDEGDLAALSHALELVIARLKQSE